MKTLRNQCHNIIVSMNWRDSDTSHPMQEFLSAKSLGDCHMCLPLFSSNDLNLFYLRQAFFQKEYKNLDSNIYHLSNTYDIPDVGIRPLHLYLNFNLFKVLSTHFKNEVMKTKFRKPRQGPGAT